MKYNININQKGLEFDNEITIREAAVIDWLHTFAGTNNRKINANKVDGWTWVNCQYLVDDLPLLRIKTRSGGSRLLTRLEQLGYIELKREPRKLFYKTTDKLDELYVAPKHQTGASKQQSWCLEAPYHNTNHHTKSLKEPNGSDLVEKTTNKLTVTERTLLGSVAGLWKDMAVAALGVNPKDVPTDKLFYSLKNVYVREKWGKEDFKALFKYYFADEGVKRENKLAYAIALSQTYIAKFKLSKKGKAIQSFASVSGDIAL